MTDSPPPSGRVTLGQRSMVRCDVKLGCWIIVLDVAEKLGFTVNVSSGGLYVRIGQGQLPPTVEVGTRVGFRLLLPGQDRPVEGAAEVAWLNSNDRDIGNKPATGVGLKIRGFLPGGQERLEAFIRQFRYTVLVMDEDPEYAGLYDRLQQDYRVLHAHGSKAAIKALESHEVSVLIADERLPDMHCLEFFRRLSERFPNARTCRLVVSEYTVAGQFQALVNVGKIFSYLRKPFSMAYLEQAVRRAVDAYTMAVENDLLSTELDRANQRLQRENAYLRRRFVGFEGFEQIVGSSRELRRLLDDLVRIRASDATVHIHGETGTGKELIARALHRGGLRAGAPFVAQNCAGLSEDLQQSMLFGHKRGAFTGADRDYAGVFERADGGTLFLDEVAELTPAIQATLLRVLQEGELTPVGAERPLKVNVRIISATHKDLREEVQRGRFREDLYFRLMVIPVRVPALRERSGDIPMLARHFLDLHCERKGKNIRGFTFEAMRALERYAWPGNVRELENEIERLVVLTEDNLKVPLELLSEHIRGSGDGPAPPARPAGQDGFRVSAGLTYDEAVESLERALIQRALEQTGGNVSQAARVLNMERSRLAKLRDRLGISPGGSPDRGASGE